MAYWQNCVETEGFDSVVGECEANADPGGHCGSEGETFYPVSRTRSEMAMAPRDTKDESKTDLIVSGRPLLHLPGHLSAGGNDFRCRFTTDYMDEGGIGRHPLVD